MQQTSFEFPLEYLSGYVEAIVFTNPENGFTVAKLKEAKKQECTLIVGTLPSLLPGESLLCEGRWSHHPTYGKQFAIEKYSITSPSDLIGIQKYLESGLVKGIGPIYAEKIVKVFGLETLQVIDQEPKKLLKIAGIGKKRLGKIIECWEAQKSIREVMIFLRAHDVLPSFAQKIFKTYGVESIAKVKENPYQLAKDILGIGFKSADTIAKKMGRSLHDPLRIRAGIEYVLWELTNSGHTCYPYTEFLPLAEKILEIPKETIEPLLQELIKKKQIVLSDLPHEKNLLPFLWLKPMHLFEEGIAKELKRILSHPCKLRPVDGEKALQWVQKKLNLHLAVEQVKAVLRGIDDKIHIITGGPGTGKSTITKALLTITEKLSDKILLAAPTGRAAKRLTQITYKKAFTIHSLLGFDFTKGGFKKNRENPLDCSLIIIDEASMIDTPLMYALLKAIPSDCRAIFVGDIDQLPSVGPGYILKDMISSNTLPVTRLTEIFRQATDSKIILNAHRINRGEFPSLQFFPKSDFWFIEAKEVEEIESKILSLVSQEIPKMKKLHPIYDIQVLSPMKRGKIGSENLNVALQKILNPSNTPFFFGGRAFHLQDKVMQIRNNYKKNIYNGDIGKIIQINPSEQEMVIAFDERLVTFEFSELDEITLAYAVSVHKYQGSECPCIVMPIHMSHFKLLHRNLLYTAVTRGKKLVALVGTKQAIALCIKNQEVQKRYTGLEKELKKYLSSS